MWITLKIRSAGVPAKNPVLPLVPYNGSLHLCGSKTVSEQRIFSMFSLAKALLIEYNIIISARIYRARQAAIIPERI